MARVDGHEDYAECAVDDAPDPENERMLDSLFYLPVKRNLYLFFIDNTNRVTATRPAAARLR
jgi:hypothetical protein